MIDKLRAVVRGGIVVAVMLVAAVAFNTCWQHYRCGYRWSEVDPAQMLRCEPIDKIEQEMEWYREMARMHPCTGVSR